MKTHCCVCFSELEHKFEINKVIKDIFDILLLEMTMEVSGSPVICDNCAEWAKKCFEFKWTLLSTEKIILSLTIVKHEEKFDINDIFEENKGMKTISEGLGVCRFCMIQWERSNLVSLDAIVNEVMFMGSLPIFVPEMDFNIIKNSVICLICKRHLESYIMFLNMILNIEENLSNFDQLKQIDNLGQSNVSNILQSSVEIKEDTDRLKNVHYEGNNEIKTERIDIKNEEIGFEKKTYKSPLEVPINEDVTYSSQKKNINNQSKRLKCELCSFETNYDYHLVRHMILHKDVSEIEMFKCALCDYETKFRRYLKPHMIKHQDKSELKWHKCMLCAYKTKYIQHLKSHMVQHKVSSKVELHKCALCAYETKYEYRLERHIIRHEDKSEVQFHEYVHCVHTRPNINIVSKFMCLPTRIYQK